MAGYGRRGRDWVSPRGNLAATLLLTLAGEMPSEGPAAYGFAAALAVRDACVASGAEPETLSLKWPNDVLLGDAKLSGVLIELLTDKDRRALALGVGVNLAEAPALSAYETAALASITPAPPPEAFLERLDDALFVWLGRWRMDGFCVLRDAWLAAASGLGERLTARLPGKTIAGTFEGLDADGALVLRTGGGRRLITAGDVFFSSRGA